MEEEIWQNFTSIKIIKQRKDRWRNFERLEETKENENNLGCPRLDPEIENGH